PPHLAVRGVVGEVRPRGKPQSRGTGGAHQRSIRAPVQRAVLSGTHAPSLVVVCWGGCQPARRKAARAGRSTRRGQATLVAQDPWQLGLQPSSVRLITVAEPSPDSRTLMSRSNASPPAVAAGDCAWPLIVFVFIRVSPYSSCGGR